MSVNALDNGSVFYAMRDFKPDVVVHQLSSLAGSNDLVRFQENFSKTNLLRTKGTDILLSAAIANGAKRFIAQSFCGWPYEQVGGNIKVESDRFDPNPPSQLRETLESLLYQENAVLSSSEISGVALRYGSFYGPNTHLCPGSEFVEVIRKRRFPIIGKGMGFWSFVHIEDVATATSLAAESDIGGVFNVVDDEPASVADWLPVLADIIGASKPFRIPKWLARILLPDHLIAMMTTSRGGSNALFRNTYQWEPKYPTWRHGFEAVFGSIRQMQDDE